MLLSTATWFSKPVVFVSYLTNIDFVAQQTIMDQNNLATNNGQKEFTLPKPVSQMLSYYTGYYNS